MTDDAHDALLHKRHKESRAVAVPRLVHKGRMTCFKRSSFCVFILLFSVLLVGGNIWAAHAFNTGLAGNIREARTPRVVNDNQSHSKQLPTTLAMTTTTSMTFVNSLSELSDDFNLFLLDMWGVLHDGSNPYQGVLDAVKQLKEQKKEMIILSNSSKRTDSSVKSLKKLGFDPTDFSQIITSGEIAFRMLEGDSSLECDSWPVLTKIRQDGGNKVFVLGSGNEDEEYCVACGWTLAPVEEADLILARGTFTICDGMTIVKKEEDENEYFNILNTSLAAAAEKKMPMLVSNPDKVRPDEGLPPMPGAIGDSYEALLGNDADVLVKRIGKPFPEVYQIALKGKDASKAVMIGDALETDVTGGSAVNIATAWCVNDGIHGQDVNKKATIQEGANAVLDAFNEKDGTYAKERVLRPTFVVPHFRW
jgi:HAD superfamily hydrolase (TIGR01459 family)